jgi:hypothetical protein
MVARLGFLSLIVAGTLICSILLSGCLGEKVPPQPPASTMTIPTRRPTTPVPETLTPVETATTAPQVTPGVTPVWTPGIVSQAGAAILIQGDIVGIRSPRGNFIDELRFTVVKASRAEPVTFEIPDTQIIFTKFGIQFGTNYNLSGDGTGDHILDEGETFAVRVFIPPHYEIYAGQVFTMAIKNPPNPPVTVTAGAPPVLQDRQVLARVLS